MSIEASRRRHLGAITRRHFLSATGLGLGAMALRALGDESGKHRAVWRSEKARAKRVIYLHMAGGPSQFELFEHKPELNKRHGERCPETLLAGRRFAFLEDAATLLGAQAQFAQHGECGAWMSDLLPALAGKADELTIVKTVHGEQFNHAPAQLLVQTGSALPGAASFGSWATYGLGSLNADLPGFIVLLSGGKTPDAGRSLWSSGFLPSIYQGVQCHSGGAPFWFAENPPGIDGELRRAQLEAMRAIDGEHAKERGDAGPLEQAAQYELAFRMQTAAPRALDLSEEKAETLAAYGVVPGQSSFAANCLLARRLAEREVRFIQLYDWGWDSHGSIEGEGLHEGFRRKVATIDRPIAALLTDLRQRGLLDETLVVWGGEFGRTPMMERRKGKENPFMGRDHHPYAFTMWMAGGGMKAGYTHGETDELGSAPIRGAVQIRDLQATILQALGLEAQQLTYQVDGRDRRLTDTGGKVVSELLA